MKKWKYEHVKEGVSNFFDQTEPLENTDEVSIVAECGINHNSDLKTAKKLIDVASHCGCDYIKFQKRDPEVCVPESKKTDMRDTPWGRMKYIDYKHQIELDKDSFEEIDEYCEERDIGWFSSVWDNPSVDFMAEFTDIGKIPSPHLTNDPVLKRTREKFDKMIISTGMSTQEQIDHAVEISNPDVIMHSVSSYPTETEEINLEYVKFLKDRFPGVEVGYSGHEKDVVSSASVVTLGAEWIERHITLDNEMWGSDQSLSLEPQELYQLVQNIKTVEKAMGGYHERVLVESEKSKKEDLRKVE